MTRSLRFHLAARFTAAMLLAMAVVGVVSVLAFRAFLDRELDAGILEVATIQGASVVDAPGGAMHFHEWDLTPAEASSVSDLIRYAQIWSENGESLLRSQFMTVDLPLDRDALSATRGGNIVWREQTFGGVPIRSLFFPLSRVGAEHAGHVIQVAAPLTSRNALVLRLTLFVTLLGLTVGIASFAGSWWLAGRAVRPIHQITDQAEAIGGGSLDRRIQAYADTREYSRLVDVLNTMLGRLQDSFQSQRRFADDASHELRSPLTALRGEIELALKRDRAPEEYRQVLRSSLEEIVRLSRLTENLLTLARLDAGAANEPSPRAPLKEVAEHVLGRLRPHAEEKGIALALTDEGVSDLSVDPGLIGPILWNLTENAIKFTPRGGTVGVAIASLDPESFAIAVSDTGPGLGPDPARLFDRFVRADAARTPGEESSGTGLGLAIVKAIVERSGGTVAAKTIPTGGALVSATLPRART